MFKPKFDIRFQNAVVGGGEVVLEMRGDWLDRNCDICWNGAPVARVRRDAWSAKAMFLNQQTYGVQVAQGVDLALVS